MEAELASLAVSGATTLVGLMASDGWNAVKARVTRLLGRGQRADVEGELAEGQRQLAVAWAAGDDAAVAGLEEAWRGRLRQLLQECPEMADALRELIAESGGGNTHHSVSNRVNGGVIRGTVVQAGDINGNITFN